VGHREWKTSLRSEVTSRPFDFATAGLAAPPQSSSSQRGQARSPDLHAGEGARATDTRTGVSAPHNHRQPSSAAHAT
jgi:hypothetical protein